jgi:hypothetical protein
MNLCNALHRILTIYMPSMVFQQRFKVIWPLDTKGRGGAAPAWHNKPLNLVTKTYLSGIRYNLQDFPHK